MTNDISYNYHYAYVNKIKKVVYLIIQERKTDFEIMKLLNIPYQTIINMVYDKNSINNIYNDNGHTYELLQKIHNENNIIQITNNIDKYGILAYHNNYLDCDDNQKITFLISLALTYRLNINSLVILTGEVDKVLFNRIASFVSNKHNLKYALDNVLFLDNNTQEESLKEALQYLENLEQVYMNHDMNKYRELRSFVGDRNIRIIKDKIREKTMQNSKYELDLFDIENIIKFQFKYSLSNASICNKFGIPANEYDNYVRKYLEFNQELVHQYGVIR